jgi:hypothetical protein
VEVIKVSKKILVSFVVLSLLIVSCKKEVVKPLAEETQSISIVHKLILDYTECAAIALTWYSYMSLTNNYTLSDEQKEIQTQAQVQAQEEETQANIYRAYRFCGGFAYIMLVVLYSTIRDTMDAVKNV